ncbi:NUDIX domain-containing protein [Candidatus Woesearchaeota archaeon]|nr:NUDIX domain-containing protein [Candidatus Woesearchaeota archaeon]
MTLEQTADERPYRLTVGIIVYRQDPEEGIRYLLAQQSFPPFRWKIPQEGYEPEDQNSLERTVARGIRQELAAHLPVQGAFRNLKDTGLTVRSQYNSRGALLVYPEYQGKIVSYFLAEYTGPEQNPLYMRVAARAIASMPNPVSPLLEVRAVKWVAHQHLLHHLKDGEMQMVAEAIRLWLTNAQQESRA